MSVVSFEVVKEHGNLVATCALLAFLHIADAMCGAPILASQVVVVSHFVFIEWLLTQATALRALEVDLILRRYHYRLHCLNLLHQHLLHLLHPHDELLHCVLSTIDDGCEALLGIGGDDVDAKATGFVILVRIRVALRGVLARFADRFREALEVGVDHERRLVLLIEVLELDDGILSGRHPRLHLRNLATSVAQVLLQLLLGGKSMEAVATEVLLGVLVIARLPK